MRVKEFEEDHCMILKYGIVLRINNLGKDIFDNISELSVRFMDKSNVFFTIGLNIQI